MEGDRCKESEGSDSLKDQEPNRFSADVEIELDATVDEFSAPSPRLIPVSGAETESATPFQAFPSMISSRRVLTGVVTVVAECDNFDANEPVIRYLSVGAGSTEHPALRALEDLTP